MSTASKIYAEINRDFANRSESFIANVILTGQSKPTTRLKNLLRHIKAGRQFSCLSFKMPYEGFFVDGVAVKPEFLLDNKTEDVEAYRFAS
jgi:hypothetical protein